MGQVATYGQIAHFLGRPKASRAVGQILRNNHDFFTLGCAGKIPCHRVVRFDGGLSGFNQGGPIKQALLTRDGVRVVKDKIDLSLFGVKNLK